MTKVHQPPIIIIIVVMTELIIKDIYRESLLTITTFSLSLIGW